MVGDQWQIFFFWYILFCFSVPVSRLPELVYKTKKDLKDSKLHSAIVGHVGDGNFHALILFDPSREFEAASGAVHRLVYRAIALDGTCVYFRLGFQSKVRLILLKGTGEHGVGVGKKEYLAIELGPNTVKLMKTIKQAIDPLNIMNPDKVSNAAVSRALLTFRSYIQTMLKVKMSNKVSSSISRLPCHQLCSNLHTFKRIGIFLCSRESLSLPTLQSLWPLSTASPVHPQSLAAEYHPVQLSQ
jgi:hypothetical protein